MSINHFCHNGHSQYIVHEHPHYIYHKEVMDNVFEETIVAEGSDGQCIWNDYCVFRIIKDCPICTSQACSSAMMTLDDLKILQPR